MFFRDHEHSLKSKRRQAMEEKEELNRENKEKDKKVIGTFQKSK
mgnify:CR=1 FL=1